MSFLDSVLKIFVGDKSKKDIKSLQPLIDKIKSHEQQLSQLSLDDLRARTTNFKAQIAEACKENNAKIATLQEEAETISDIERKDDIYQEIDTLRDEEYEITEAVLLDILPEAFAVVKETAKRFTNNTEITVTANPFDREVSGMGDYVTLDGDQATWSNSWDAVGKPITWDMIHYDVQLIGGIAMHQGKIAEMQTGEGKTLVATLTGLPKRINRKRCALSNG